MPIGRTFTIIDAMNGQGVSVIFFHFTVVVPAPGRYALAVYIRDTLFGSTPVFAQLVNSNPVSQRFN
jgi:hypothetical protein